jgi:hypothetical protein
MATEEKELWGKTSYREIHCGHIHGQKLKEQFGVKVRHLSSLCSTDAYHTLKGYIGNIRAAEGFLYTKNKGLAAHYHYNVE